MNIETEKLLRTYWMTRNYKAFFALREQVQLEKQFESFVDAFCDQAENNVTEIRAVFKGASWNKAA